jgi:oligopeptidase B
MSTPPSTPPVAAKRPHRIEQLGRVRVDDYAWMKDDNWQQVLRDPATLRGDVREHLDAENAYAKAMLADTEALQAQMFGEMKGRIKEDDSSVPSPDGPWDYYVRYDTGAQHPIHARRPRGQADAPEQVLLDEEALAKGKPFFQVGAASHSPDHALYAWAADEQGSEYFTIRVTDLATGETLGTPIESGYGALTFSPDSQWLFWIWRDENARPAKVFRRPSRPGKGGRPDKTWGGDDVLVYEEPDDGMFLGVGTTSDDSHIVIGSGNQETTARWTSSSRPAPPTSPPRPPGRTGFLTGPATTSPASRPSPATWSAPSGSMPWTGWWSPRAAARPTRSPSTRRPTPCTSRAATNTPPRPPASSTNRRPRPGRPSTTT